MHSPGMMAHTCNTCNLNTWEAKVGEGLDETGLYGENQPKNRMRMYYISQECCPIKNVYVIHVYSK